MASFLPGAVRLDLRALKGRLDLQARAVRPAVLERLGQPERKALPEYRARLELLGQMGLPEPQERPALLALLEHRGLPE